MDIVEANIDKLQEINNFLIKHFFTREPLGLKLGIIPEKDTRQWLSEVTRPLLNQRVILQCRQYPITSRKFEIIRLTSLAKLSLFT